MKKLFGNLFNKSFFYGISFGIGLLLIVGMGSLFVWAANNFNHLKSYNNDNKLTAPMRDELVDRVGEFTMPDFVCGIQHRKHNPSDAYFTNNNCTIQNIISSLGYWLDDGGNPTGGGYNLTVSNIIKKSRNLGKREFCSIIGIGNVGDTQVCMVYPYRDNWYLYVNEHNGHTFCHAACFGWKTDPQCGVTSSYSEPYYNLCSVGSPSSVSGNGPRSWTCSAAGKSISCKANKKQRGGGGKRDTNKDFIYREME